MGALLMSVGLALRAFGFRLPRERRKKEALAEESVKR